VQGQPRVGMVVDVLAGENPPKLRPGVIVRVTDDLVTVCLVAWGSGTEPAERKRHGDPHVGHVAVLEGSPEHAALRLTKDTYFYPGERKTYEPGELSLRAGALLCPLPLLQRLIALHRSR
jgi:hypothetical protein